MASADLAGPSFFNLIVPGVLNVHRAAGLAVLLLVAVYVIHSCTAEPPAPGPPEASVAYLAPAQPSPAHVLDQVGRAFVRNGRAA
jgi:hypothetical protein